MNTDGEGQLRTRLDAALAQLDPGPLPLDAVVSQGRVVMLRRRAVAAAAVVVVAAAALAVPRLAHDLAHPSPSAPTRYHVTVHPGNEAQHVIAYGRVINGLNDMRWSVSGVVSGSRFRIRWRTGPWRYYDHGGLLRVGAGNWVEPFPLPAMPANPADIFDQANPDPELLALAVRPDVSYLVVVLSNGQEVTLRPATVLGSARPRLAAISVPVQMSITQIRAYSASGELGYTVPYQALPLPPSPVVVDSQADLELVRWLKPGQPALPASATYSIGHGSVLGTAWSERLRVGPWGTCVVAAVGTTTCFPAIGRGLLGGKAGAGLTYNYYSQKSLGWDAIVLEPAVSSVVTRMRDGRLIPTRIYSVDGVKFATIAWLGEAKSPAGWTAYSASGQVLASGYF